MKLRDILKEIEHTGIIGPKDVEIGLPIIAPVARLNCWIVLPVLLPIQYRPCVS